MVLDIISVSTYEKFCVMNSHATFWIGLFVTLHLTPRVPYPPPPPRLSFSRFQILFNIGLYRVLHLKKPH